MSGRTFPPFALVGLLTASLAAPLAAQSPPAVAPMPREKSPEPRFSVPTLGPIGLATDFNVPVNMSPGDHKQLVNIGVGVFGNVLNPSLPVAPMPREKTSLLTIEYSIDVLNAYSDDLRTTPVQSERTFDRSPPVPPMPVPTPPPHCAFDNCPQPPSPQNVSPQEAASTAPLNPDCQQLHKMACELFADGGSGPGQPAAQLQCQQPGFYYSAEYVLTSGRAMPPAPATARPVPMPRAIVEIIGDIEYQTSNFGFEQYSTPVFRAAPITGATRSVCYPYPLLGVTTVRCDNNGGWWVEVTRIPQPRQSQNPCRFVVVLDGFPPETQPCTGPDGPMTPAAKPALPCCGGAYGTATAALIGNRIDSATDCPMCNAKAGKLSGTWVREMGGTVIVVTFNGDEMKLCFSMCDEGTIATITVTAEYAVTKEGLVHGVLTGTDAEVKRDPKLPAAVSGVPTLEFPDAALPLMLQGFVDAPFSFRIKNTSAGVMVTNLKIAGLEGMDPRELAMLGGMFKPCKGAIPTPKPMKTSQGCVPGGMTLPSGRYLDHYPQYFSPNDQPAGPPLATGTAPVGIGPPAPTVSPYGDWTPAPSPQTVPAMPVPQPPCVTVSGGCGLPPVYTPAYGCPSSAPPANCPQPQPGWNPTPTRPSNVPAGDFGMMADVFGQMVGVQPPCPAPLRCLPQPCPAPTAYAAPLMLPPAPCPVQTAPVQPVGGYGPLPTSYPQMPPGTTMPAPAPIPVTPIKPGIVGTWYRQFGGKFCVVKIAPDHLTMSMTEVQQDEDGKSVSGGWVITADYHMTRDGTTAIGLITGVDIEIQGDLPERETDSLTEALEDLQKGMSDKPFAMTLRVYGDSLVIGNVRMPEVSGDNFDTQPATLIGGRYKNATDKPLPKPKVMNKYSSDPNERMQQLLKESEDLRMTRPEERRFWSTPPSSPYLPNTATVPGASPGYPSSSPSYGSPQPTDPPSATVPPMSTPTPPVIEEPQPKKKGKKKPPDEQPSHLTPERIHGGIQ